MIFYRDSLLVIYKNKKSIKDLDFKDWIIKDEDCDNFLYPNLRKWVKYKSGVFPDADVVIKMNKGEIFNNLNWDVKWIDCIFSMQIFFNAFLRYYAPNYLHYGQLYDNFDLIFSDNYINLFCRGKCLNDENKREIKELFAELDRFAKNTHTIGNYMPCPDGVYNRYKANYNCFQDRIELLYSKVLENTYCDSKQKVIGYEYKKFLINNKDKMFLDTILNRECVDELKKFEITEKKGRGFVICSDNWGKYKDYLKCINDLIENRSRKIETKIGEIINENQA